jgi:hypothetical protein
MFILILPGTEVLAPLSAAVLTLNRFEADLFGATSLALLF